ncbi:MAG: LysE family transporter [Alphaproteobacteria bacterium]|nr:LysE family transporter [Alphaproteobacteria bacterium]HPF46020.1 LysE family transporter [Emcibacteraceae bacterium]
MSLIYLPWGIFIGLIMAAPIGPVNIICIRRALTMGSMNGFVVGLGAALADGFFGALAAFGLAGLTRVLNDFNGWIEIVGGTVVIIIGARLWFSHPHVAEVNDSYKDRFKAAIGTFLLTMTNPLTVLGFVAVFVSLGLGNMGNNYLNATAVSVGILLGSTLWWAMLSIGAGKISKKLTDEHLEKVNKISAVIIIIFGLIAIFKNLAL